MIYVVGGVVAYILNRRHVFASERPHAEATWRFALVVFVGFCVTYALVSLIVDRWGAPYLQAQLVTTIAVMFATFTFHRRWTFG